MTIIFWLLLGILSYYISNDVDKLIKSMLYDKGYILNSDIAKLNKYASSNIVSLEISLKERIINILKKLVFFIPGVSLIILLAKYTQFMFRDKYVDKLINRHKVADINSSEAINALNIEKEVNKLLTERKQDIFDKIIVFLDNTLGKRGFLNVTINDKVIIGKKDSQINNLEEVKSDTESLDEDKSKEDNIIVFEEKVKIEEPKDIKFKIKKVKHKKVSLYDQLDKLVDKMDDKIDSTIDEIDSAMDTTIDKADLFIDKTVNKVDIATDKMRDSLDIMSDSLDKTTDKIDKVLSKILK